MSLNNKKAIGDDQDWKAEVESELKKQADNIAYLLQQVNNLTQRLGAQ